MTRSARHRYTPIMRYLIAALALFSTLALVDIVGPARVIDSDTIEIAGQRIRLHGVVRGDATYVNRFSGGHHGAIVLPISKSTRRMRRIRAPALSVMEMRDASKRHHDREDGDGQR